MISKLFKSSVNWIKNNKFEFFLIFAILLIGAVLRLYKISEYMTFLGDEGRDAIVVRRLLTKGDLIFVGPGTSIGNMYLGPLYYYMMAPFLLLANFSPVGPSVMVALLGVATIFLIWFIAREWFGKAPALIAALLYSVSATAIIFSRSSWNPNIMPFFALFSVYAAWKIYELRSDVSKTRNWLVALGISYAFVLQSHYLGLLIAPAIFVFWFLSLRSNFDDKNESKKFIKYSLIGFLAFFILMSPLLLFDFKHDFRNFMGMRDFITGSKDNYSPSLENTLSKVLPMARRVVTRVMAARNETLGLLGSALLLTGTFLAFLRNGKRQIVLLGLWFLFGCFGIALLRQDIYDHYLGFLFPVPFLLLAANIESFFLNKSYKKVLLGTLIIGLSFFSFNDFISTNYPVRQYQRSIEIAKKIQVEAKGERFNLATLSALNNRDVYQYFLELWGEKIVDTDPLNTKFTITDQLFVVCEKPKEECDPVHDPSAWITHFGWSTIVDSWQVEGVNLYKLGHSEEWLKMRDQQQ